MKHLAVRTALLSVLIAGAGCSSPPVQQAQEEAPPAAAETQAQAPADPVEAALARANQENPAARADLIMDAASLLITRNEYVRARSLLDDMRGAPMAPEQMARRAILLSGILLGTGDPAGALGALGDVSGSAGTALPRAVETGLREARARALLALGRPLASAMERTALQPWITEDEARESNARQILDALGNVPLGELERAAAQAGSDDWRGWLDLSLILRDMRRLPGEQRKSLAEWEQRHAGIPAFGTGITQQVARLSSGIAEPRRVALLLPLSGKAGTSGQAVLQGYLAEHYRTLAAGEATPSLAIVDTGGTADGFAAAYRKTTADGAEVVLGPLLKEELLSFRAGLAATAPTLALNFLDAPAAALPGVRQFGIDLADEVMELGQASRREGLTRAMVLADASPRARRLVEGFGSQWRDAGGDLIDALYLGDLNEYRSSLERALHLDRSHQRSATLGGVVGLELQTEPRRRMDVDLVVILAEPAGARSIRAMLPFLYAGDIPVRATSMSYAAGSEQAGDLDLEKVQLLDMPWFSGSEDFLRATASPRHGPVERLVALGVDAQRLQSRLALLDLSASRNLGGATGELSAERDGRVHRRTVWYAIDGGQARATLPRNAITTSAPREGAETWTPVEGVAPQTSVVTPNPEP